MSARAQRKTQPQKRPDKSLSLYQREIPTQKHLTAIQTNKQTAHAVEEKESDFHRYHVRFKCPVFNKKNYKA